MLAAGLYLISFAAQVDMCPPEVGASQSNMYRDLGEAVLQLLARNLAAREQPCQALEGSMTPHHPATLGREPTAQPPCRNDRVLPPLRPGNAPPGGRPLKPNTSLHRGGPMAGYIMRRRADRLRRACATTFWRRRRLAAFGGFGALKLDHRSPDNGQLEVP